MVKVTGIYPRVGVDSGEVAAVGHAGGVLLTETVRVTGLAGACRPRSLGGASRWRAMIRRRWCWISRSRSRWVGTR